MSENRKTAILVFGLGLVATLLALPFLYALGLPSFEVVLMGLFGEGNAWALVFTIVLVALLLYGIRKSFNSSD